MMPIFVLMLAPNPPKPIGDAQMSDLACVAAIGIVAFEQRSGQPMNPDYPDVRESGKRWAGIVGQRVMDETGQPREVVAFAMQKMVETMRAQADKAADPKTHVEKRFADCNARMTAELARQPLPEPAQ